MLSKVSVDQIDKNGFFEIPHGVVHLGPRLISDPKQLKNIRFPQTVNYIPESAFIDCGLEILHLPDSIGSIDNTAFERCPLKTLRLPKGLQYLGAYALAYCDNLETIFLPKGGLSCSRDAFIGTNNVRTLVLPEGFSEKENMLDRFYLGNVETIIISSSDSSEIERITQLLPESVKNKTIIAMDIDKMYEAQFIRILSTLQLNPLYPLSNSQSLIAYIPKELFPQIAGYFIKEFSSLFVCWEIQNLMLGVDLPQTQAEVEDYQTELEKIADTIINQVAQIPEEITKSLNLYDRKNNFTLFQLKSISESQANPETLEVIQQLK